VLYLRLCRAGGVIASRSMESRGRDFSKRHWCAGKVYWLAMRECHIVNITWW